jgi:hypothetical protein
MTLNNIKKNMTELRLMSGTVLFSYQTPVAFISNTGEIFRTDKKWSNTTTRHINTWLGLKAGKSIGKYMPQEFFDNLIKGV